MSRDAQLRDRARQLRRDLTLAEKILWRHLRARQFAGLKFRRQHPVGPFYPDFVCVEARLIVELDGETHLGREADDARRTAYLAREGWAVLRFWNTSMFDEEEAVLERIHQECLARMAIRAKV